MKNNRTFKDALYVDCETDEERAEFFASGRAWETGIIARSVAEEIAEVFRFRAAHKQPEGGEGKPGNDQTCEYCRGTGVISDSIALTKPCPMCSTKQSALKGEEAPNA